ncbi:hypothetical protein AYP97_02285 [Lactobacillus crispatus]|jgi:peptidoglycan/LPS O-acetylase OafA/YrhL|uniref:Uncharacterized protein n=2 Tax=Lactobacillus TaxID=1578 RepID=A0A1C2D3X3_9LACO|nr:MULTISPECIES: hypothetical protein [Lactobacillus]EST04152.1 hypothetical protein Lc367_0048 [Lactobacillus crispatus EM-LC1]KAA8789359.1 hypothetical protein F1B94_06150 [Lactobacillus crispatus]KAA8789443.1 hypothetical protein F1B98_06145 [Lactobacillus crispatus]KAA8809052.1 hypothetical protein F1C08_08485 [Lactobacillus crispatus]MBE5057915.1 hypothetical protein [Lactobacillus crispatus]
MWVILVINVVIAIIAIIARLNNGAEAFNLFNGGLVFVTFGIVLLLGAIPVYRNFDTSSVLMFVAGILIVLGIIMLIVSVIARSTRKINLQDLAIALMVAAVCLVYFIHNASLNFANLLVPELALIVGLILLVYPKQK